MSLPPFFDSSNLNSAQELINEYGNFDENMIQKYSKQLLQGLKYLHEKNIFHKNFTPKNILIDTEGNIKISDSYIDSIILGSAKEIYDNLLSLSNDIEYYIPPFSSYNKIVFTETELEKIDRKWKALQRDDKKQIFNLCNRKLFRAAYKNK